MNTIKFRCASIKCGKILSVPADQRGQMVKCPTCKRVVRVPAERPAAAAAQPQLVPAPPPTVG
jgi:phage FluMu protein Com